MGWRAGVSWRRPRRTTGAAERLQLKGLPGEVHACRMLCQVETRQPAAPAFPPLEPFRPDPVSVTTHRSEGEKGRAKEEDNSVTFPAAGPGWQRAAILTDSAQFPYCDIILERATPPFSEPDTLLIPPQLLPVGDVHAYCSGLTLLPHRCKFVCCSPNSQYLRVWPYLKTGSSQNKQVQMKSLGWAL